MSEFHAALARFLGPWPDDYLVVDCETVGLDRDSVGCVPVELGWAYVRGRRVVDDGSAWLDWTRPGYADVASELAGRVARVRDHMARRGLAYRVDLPRIRRGIDPAAGLAAYRGALARAVAAGRPIVGFNHAAFDLPLLSRCFASYLDDPLEVPDGLALDLGMAEKARALGLAVPRPGACGRSAWYARVHAARGRGKWGLDAARARYAIDTEPDAAHEAAADCRATHRLLERYRELAGAAVAPAALPA